MAATTNSPGITASRIRDPGRRVWPLLLWFGLLLGACYAPVLWRLVQVWDSDPDMGHGFFVPLVSLAIIWLKRERLAQLPVLPNPWGIVLVVYAAAQYY